MSKDSKVPMHKQMAMGSKTSAPKGKPVPMRKGGSCK